MYEWQLGHGSVGLHVIHRLSDNNGFDLESGQSVQEWPRVYRFIGQ